jgi:hypothetical protein
VTTVLSFLFRILRYAFFASLAVAGAAKFLLESNADPDTEEIDLVSIYEGKTLLTSADPFYGGKILAMFSGTLIDMRKATPAPTGIDLDVAMCFGGLSLIVPEGWRVRSEIDFMPGAFTDNTKTTAEQDMPTVRLRGYVAFGRVVATTRSPMEVVK